MGHLHTEPLRYDLACLRSLVETLEPDLLGVELDLDSWERGDLGGAPVEVREGLVPATRRVDTVVVPLGGASPLEFVPPEEGELAQLRASVVRASDNLLMGLQRAVDGPEGINSLFFRHMCGFICYLEAATASDAGRRAWEESNERILERLLWVIDRDPGRRVLAAVQCRRVHWLEPRVKRMPNTELVDYREL
jgi:hypothetical protein